MAERGQKSLPGGHSSPAPREGGHGLPLGAFARIDEDPDEEFYAPPRLVHHIDEGARAALSAFYAQALAPGSDVLDLMSSWVSHLPAELALRSLIGVGMNAEELASNPRLTARRVINLNLTPALPLEDQSLDAALCCVSVQYLIRPLEVFEEVRRCLRPGAAFLVSISNRCFPTKAVALWRALEEAQKLDLVSFYFSRSGFEAVRIHRLAAGPGDALWLISGRRPGNAAELGGRR